MPYPLKSNRACGHLSGLGPGTCRVWCVFCEWPAADTMIYVRLSLPEEPLVQVNSYAAVPDAEAQAAWSLTFKLTQWKGEAGVRARRAPQRLRDPWSNS